MEDIMEVKLVKPWYYDWVFGKKAFGKMMVSHKNCSF
jgi:hypothetical protein